MIQCINPKKMPLTGHFFWLLFRKFRDFIAQQLHFGQSIYNNGSVAIAVFAV